MALGPEAGPAEPNSYALLEYSFATRHGFRNFRPGPVPQVDTRRILDVARKTAPGDPKAALGGDPQHNADLGGDASPARAAVTFLRPTAGEPIGAIVMSNMAGVAQRDRGGNGNMSEPDLKPFFFLIVTDHDRLMSAVQCPMSDAGPWNEGRRERRRNFQPGDQLGPAGPQRD